MKKLLITVALLAAALTLSSVVVTHAATTYLVNEDYEDQQLGSFPAGWTSADRGAVDAEISATYAANSAHSLHFWGKSYCDTPLYKPLNIPTTVTQLIFEWDQLAPASGHARGWPMSLFRNGMVKWSINMRNEPFYGIYNSHSCAAFEKYADLVLDKWYHMKIVYDLTTEAGDVYVDGLLAGTISCPINWSFGNCGTRGPMVDMLVLLKDCCAPTSLYLDNLQVYYGVDDNEPPVAEAGAYQVVYAGQTARLDGTGSADPDGDPVTYFWQENPLNPQTGLLAGASSALQDVSLLLPGTYGFTLTVSDGQTSSSDSVVVDVLGLDGLLTSNPDLFKSNLTRQLLELDADYSALMYMIAVGNIQGINQSVVAIVNKTEAIQNYIIAQSSKTITAAEVALLMPVLDAYKQILRIRLSTPIGQLIDQPVLAEYTIDPEYVASGYNCGPVDPVVLESGAFLCTEVVYIGGGNCMGLCGIGCPTTYVYKYPDDPTRYTQQCLNHDLCTLRQGEKFGVCSTEFGWAILSEVMR